MAPISSVGNFGGVFRDDLQSTSDTQYAEYRVDDGRLCTKKFDRAFQDGKVVRLFGDDTSLGFLKHDKLPWYAGYNSDNYVLFTLDGKHAAIGQVEERQVFGIKPYSFQRQLGRVGRGGSLG